ncbi:MAG TPA: helix-turn-helix transcriptional regulator [Ktedonobacterales bacterium]|nr:helix-turn-helix transcriptional regulator [Ktedonobacterales bacterium]
MSKGWKKHIGYDWHEFGAWVKESRQTVGWTLEQFGKKIGIVHKGTIAKIEQGKQGLSVPQREQVVDLLADELTKLKDLPSRREFIKAAGLFVAGLRPAVEEPNTNKKPLGPVNLPPSRIIQELDELVFDMGASLIRAWDTCLFQGHSRLVYQEAGPQYHLLRESSKLDDAEIALTAIRFGIRWARAHEAVFSWFERNAGAIAIYNDIEARIINRWIARPLRNRDIARTYVHLLALRGTLYREIGLRNKALSDFQKGETLARNIGEASLLINIVCDTAHLWVGEGEKARWMEELERAREVARSAQATEREIFDVLIMYTEGAGYKRLAFDARGFLSMSEREALAAMAIREFQESQSQIKDHWLDYVIKAGVLGHPLITSVSEAQCLIWTDPAALEEKLIGLKQRVTSEYPSLLGKVAISEPWLQGWSGWNANNPLPVFDLSGKVGFDGKPKPRFSR